MTDAELIAWCKEYAVEKRKEAECADYDHWRNSYIREADTFDAIAARLAQPTPESVVALARKRWPEACAFGIGIYWSTISGWSFELQCLNEHFLGFDSFTAPTLAELAREVRKVDRL